MHVEESFDGEICCSQGQEGDEIAQPPSAPSCWPIKSFHRWKVGKYAARDDPDQGCTL